MQNQQFRPASEDRDAAWSNRILLLAVAGILFLTLYPFRFDLHTPNEMRSVFLLGKGLKKSGFYDAFLNVLLFAPFGFGLAEKLRERGKSRPFAFAVVLIAGASFSYLIEFLQIYIPERDSGWEDVFTNASGSVAGFLVFELLGATTLRVLSAGERALGSLLSGRRAAFMLCLYFGLWFLASILLQKQTRLTNWQPDSRLVIGNDAAGESTWLGQIRLVQIWDRPISNEQAKGIVAVESAAAAPGLLASYDFSSAAPFHDQRSFLPDLVWTPRIPARLETSPLVLDGSAWLSSKLNVPGLVQDLQKSNQFAIRIVCAPGSMNAADVPILSISQSSGLADLSVRQEAAALVFSFRNGVSVKKSSLAWRIPDAFSLAATRDILYSYDGSNLSLYLDGKPQPTRYQLGPGAALAVFVRRIKPAELSGYNYIYYALVFFPVGALLGMAGRQTPANRLASYVTFGVVTLVFPLSLEFGLVWMSGRGFSFANVVLSFVLVIAGSFWINADHVRFRAAQ